MTNMNDLRSHLDDARCSDLVLDLLDPESRAQALAHASECPRCAERMRSHVAAVARMRADQPAARVVPLRAWGVAPVLAAAAALVLFVWWPRGGDPPAVHPTTWLAMPSEGVLLREGEAVDPHLAAGFAAYARHDLATAQRELEVATARETAEQARRLYLAHVLLVGGESERALVLLRSLAWIELPAAVRHDGARLLVEALHRTGHARSADSLDHALRTTPEWIPLQP